MIPQQLPDGIGCKKRRIWFVSPSPAFFLSETRLSVFTRPERGVSSLRFASKQLY